MPLKACIALLLLGCAASAAADDAKPNRIERGAQSVEKGVKKTAKRTGDWAERTANKTEKGVKRVVDRTEKKVKKILE